MVDPNCIARSEIAAVHIRIQLEVISTRCGQEFMFKSIHEYPSLHVIYIQQWHYFILIQKSAKQLLSKRVLKYQFPAFTHVQSPFVLTYSCGSWSHRFPQLLNVLQFEMKWPVEFKQSFSDVIIKRAGEFDGHSSFANAMNSLQLVAIKSSANLVVWAWKSNHNLWQNRLAVFHGST